MADIINYNVSTFWYLLVKKKCLFRNLDTTQTIGFDEFNWVKP